MNTGTNSINRLYLVLIFTVSAWTNIAFCGEIHDAAKAGNLEQIKTLLRTNPFLIDIKGEYDLTPLVYACGYQNKAVIKFLLEQGAKVDTKPDPLTEAVLGNADIEIVSLLLQKGANPNANDQWGSSVLLNAVLGADTRNKGGPIDEQLTQQRTEIINILLKAGANPESGHIEKDGSIFTPLMAATAHNLPGVTKLFLENKANVNAQCRGLTALAFAARNNNIEIIQLLLESGADVNAGTTSPLHLAARGGNIEAIKILIAHNANVDSTDSKGQTALEYAQALLDAREEEHQEKASAQVIGLRNAIQLLREQKAKK